MNLILLIIFFGFLIIYGIFIKFNNNIFFLFYYMADLIGLFNHIGSEEEIVINILLYLVYLWWVHGCHSGEIKRW